MNVGGRVGPYRFSCVVLSLWDWRTGPPWKVYSGMRV
jgi:hypothetical protein